MPPYADPSSPCREYSGLSVLESASQPFYGPARPLFGGGNGFSRHSDMPKLAAEARFFAVQVNVDHGVRQRLTKEGGGVRTI